MTMTKPGRVDGFKLPALSGTLAGGEYRERDRESAT